MRLTHSHVAYETRTFISASARLVLGRTKAELDLTPDMQVSQIHAAITFENGGWWIEDLGSLNGVLLNGKVIRQKTKVTPVDELQLGETKIRVQREEEDITNAGSRVTVEPAVVPQTTVAPVSAAASAMDDGTRRRLSVFYKLGSTLGSLASLDILLKEVLGQLLEGVGTAQRGAVLLLDGERLLLKSHFPEGQPSASLSLSQQAIERREAFIWRRNEEAPQDSPRSIVRSETQCAMYAPLLINDETLGVCCVDSYIDRNVFNNDDLYLLMAMSYQAAMLVKSHALQNALREETALRANMVRWFSPKIAKRLLARENVLPVNERVYATILCSDIRGFTALARNMPPEEVVSSLNETFEVLIPLIFKYDGTIDKFIGDSILAVFGSPEPDAKQWEHAIHAAVEMQEAIAKLSAHRQAEGKPVFEIGIGIHCGYVIHGVIGAQERIEFTIIGDAVNRAARLCDGAGKGEVLVSREVYERSFHLIEVTARTVASKHAEAEGLLQAYLIHKLKGDPK